MKIQPATGSFARNLIYSTKPSAAHQDMAEMHKKMMKAKPENTQETAKPFSEMSEHEKAAVVHEKANNGQSSVIHQQQAEKHRSQITQN
nr:hypothetical protein [Klebsiella michiganensis]